MNRHPLVARVLVSGLLAFAAQATAEPPPDNLIANASFELGLLKDGWGVLAPDICLVPENITDADAVHGKRSLTLEGNIQFFSRYMSFPRSGEYRFRFHAKASSSATVTVAFRACPPPSEDPAVTERTLGTKAFPVTRDWRRCEMTAHLPEGQFAVLISVVHDSAAGRSWFDAFELSMASTAEVTAEEAKPDETGDDLPEEEAAPFRPSRAIEAGLASDIPGHVFYRNEPSPVSLHLFNNGRAAAKASISYEIRDLDDQVVKTGTTTSIDVPPGRLISTPFPVPTDTNGLFSIQYRLTQAPGPASEIVYTVVEKPTADTILGAHTYADKYHLAILQRAGVKWYVSLTDTFLRSVCVHPEPDRYVWDDARAQRLRDLGFLTIGVLEHAMFPAWGPRTEVRLDTPVLKRGGYFESRSYVSEEVWREHVRQVVSHYRDTFQRWIIDDEINAGWDPKGYVRILQQARETARQVLPSAQITTSADVHFFEELIAIAGPGSFDAICGSIGNASLWEKRKTRFLSEKYQKPVWVNAVFGYGRSAYRTHQGPGTLDRLDRAISLYRHTVRNFFISRATYVSPYIFRLSKKSTTRTMPHTMLDYDGGLLPHGFGFVHAGTQLAALAEENIGMLPSASPARAEAYAFAGHGRAGVFLLGPQATLSLRTVDGLQAVDWLGRPQALTPDGNSVSIPITHGPVILTAPAAQRETLFRSVQDIESQETLPVGEPQIAETFSCPNGQLHRERRIANPWDKALVVPLAADSSLTLQPGEAKTVSEPVPWNPDRPLDNWLGTGGRRLWLHNCMRAPHPPRIDGDLADWEDRSASWVLMTWDILAFYSRRDLQVLRGGEQMSYEPWRDCKTGFRSAWDDTSVYFAIAVSDDSVPAAGDDLDRIVIRLGQVPGIEVSAGPHVQPTSNSEKCQVEQAARQVPGGYHLELKLRAPDIRPQENQPIPFDLLVHDTDWDEAYRGEERYRWGRAVLRWAGGSRSGGQMIFTRPYQAPQAPALTD